MGPFVIMGAGIGGHVDHAVQAGGAWDRSVTGPGPIVVGAVQRASCYGPVYESVFIMDTDLRKRKIRRKVPITFATAPRGFILVAEPQRNPSSRNIYSVGLCVAIPPAQQMPVPTGAPDSSPQCELVC